MPPPKSPELLSEASVGSVVFDSEVTLGQVATLKDPHVRQILKLGDEIAEQPLGELTRSIRNPKLVLQTDRGLAAQAVRWSVSGGESGKVFAAPDDLMQFAVWKEPGLLTDEEALRLAISEVRSFILAEREMPQGDLLAIRPEGSYLRRAGGYMASRSIERAMAKVEHDCERVEIAVKLNPLEFWVGAYGQVGIQEVERRLRASDFADTRMEVVPLNYGLPLHTTFMAPYLGDFRKVLAEIGVRQTSGIIIPNTTGEPKSVEVLLKDFINPTAVVERYKMEETLNNLGVKDRQAFNIEQANNWVSTHATRRNLGIVGVALAVLAGGGVAAKYLWDRYMKDK